MTGWSLEAAVTLGFHCDDGLTKWTEGAHANTTPLGQVSNENVTVSVGRNAGTPRCDGIKGGEPTKGMLRVVKPSTQIGILL